MEFIEDARKKINQLTIADADTKKIEELIDQLNLNVKVQEMSMFELDNYSMTLQHLGKLLELKVEQSLRYESSEVW